MMIRSTPALSVIIDTGQVPQAPTSETCTTPSSSMPLKTMSPPSLWSAGRIASIASRTAGFHLGEIERHQYLQTVESIAWAQSTASSIALVPRDAAG